MQNPTGSSFGKVYCSAPLLSWGTDHRTCKDSRYEQTRSVAMELFVSRGFSNVSMRDLAKHLGISHGSIYNHIESKEQLLYELIESLYSDLLELVFVQEKKSGEPSDALAQLMKDHLQLHEQKSQLFWLAEHEMHCLSAAHRQEIWQLRQQYEMYLTQLLSHLLCAESEALQSAVPPLLVAILNNLPAWLQQSAMNSEQRSSLLVDMALGALYGALHSNGATHFSLTHPVAPPLDN